MTGSLFSLRDGRPCRGTVTAAVHAVDGDTASVRDRLLCESDVAAAEHTDGG